MSKVKFCIFASTPDVLQYKSIVNVLTGTPEEVARCAVNWEYDGIEFVPNPERVPDPEIFANALQRGGAIMPVVSSGRIAAQGMALLHEAWLPGGRQSRGSRIYWTLPVTLRRG